MARTPFNFIVEGSQATPGLWNSPLSALSRDLDTLLSGGTTTFAAIAASSVTVSGSVTLVGPLSIQSGPVRITANSNSTNYIFFTDSSNQRSNYIIGSQVGGTADGLNIFDASGNTMIASFSKQSIRFFQNVVGPVFDIGGSLTGTSNAAVFGTASDSTESRIQSAINDAALTGKARVYIPANMYPYSASSVSFIHTVQMVREGGDWSVYDVRAYGSDPTGVKDATASGVAAIAGAFAAGPGARVRLSLGTHKMTSFNLTGTRGIIIEGEASSIRDAAPFTTASTLLITGNGGGTVSNRTNGGIRIWGGDGLVTTNFLFRDLNIDYDTATLDALINISSFNTDSSGPGYVYFDHCAFGGRVAGTTTKAFWISGLNNWGGIRRCVFNGNFQQEIVQKKGGSSVFNGWTIEENVFNARITAGQFHIDLEQAQFLSITGNNFEVTGAGIRLTNGDATPANLFNGVIIDRNFIGDSVSGTSNTTCIVANIIGGALRGNVLYGAIGSTNQSMMEIRGSDILVQGNFLNYVTGTGIWINANNSHFGPNNINGSGGVAIGMNVAGGVGLVIEPGGLSSLNVPIAVDGSVSALVAGIIPTGSTGVGGTATNLAIVNTGTGGTPVTTMQVQRYAASAPGSAILPAYATSEASLGFYRSAASTMALSYGSFEMTQGNISITAANANDAAVFLNQAGIGGWYIKNQANTGTLAVTNAGTTYWGFSPSGGTFFPITDNVYDFGLSVSRARKLFWGTAAQGPTGSAVTPAYTFDSEVSLGFYRSATSTMAFSYGTIDLTGSGAMTSIASLKVKAGANNSCGTAVLGSNGSVNVANTYVKTGDLIFLTDQTPGGTLGDLELTGIRNSSGFTIASTSVTDTSTVAWLIIRPG